MFRMVVARLAFLVLTAFFLLPLAYASEIASAPSVEVRYAGNLLRLINEYRHGLGLEALILDEDLSAIAAEHNEYMTRHRRLSHDHFRQRLERSRSRLCVENVGLGYRYPKAQLDGWIDSPGHNRNLLEAKVRHVGIAVADRFVTFFACS